MYGLKLFDLSDPNLDPDEILIKMFDYMRELEGPDTASTIEESPKHGSHITLEKIIKPSKYKWGTEDRIIEKIIIGDSKKNRVNKFYFGGESDSNQTKYEILLNNRKICTKSTSDKVGKVLIVLLRIIIDDRGNDYLISELEMMDELFPPNRMIGGKRIPPDHYYIYEIVNYLEKNENYRHTHDMRDGVYVETKLSGYKYTAEEHIGVSTKIRRFMGDVDVWDIFRIYDALGLTLPYQRYKNIEA